MAALNFMAQFADPVESREKRQSIRANAARFTVGRPIQLYTGMRTAACRKLVAEDPICTSIEPVVIAVGGVCKIGNEFLGGERLADFAVADGFPSATAFFEFFPKVAGRFDGFLIRWDWK